MYDETVMLMFLQHHAQTCMMLSSSFPRQSTISRLLQDHSQSYAMMSQMWLSWSLIMDDDDDFMGDLEDFMMINYLQDLNRINHLLKHHDDYEEEEEDDDDNEDDPVTDSHNDPILLDTKFDSRRNLENDINQEKESHQVERGVPKEIYVKTSVGSKTTTENRTGEGNGRNLKRKASDEEQTIISSDGNNLHSKKKKSAKR